MLACSDQPVEGVACPSAATIQLRASWPVCLHALAVVSLFWEVDPRDNDLLQPSLSLLGQSLYPPVCLFQEGRKTQGGEKGINCLMRPCLPSRGQNLCMHFTYFPITNIDYSYDYAAVHAIQSKLNSHSLRSRRGLRLGED